MNEAKKSIRLRYFIRSGLQLRFLRVNILLAVFVSLAVAFFVYQLSMDILGASLEEIYPPGLLNGIYQSLTSALGLRLLFIILAVVIATFLVFHHIAGPAYHIERDLAAMAEGDLTKRIYLRKHDELKPIANKINKFADSISQNLNSIKKNLETMGKLCEEIRSDQFDLSMRKDVSEKLVASLKEARDSVSQFKLMPAKACD